MKKINNLQREVAILSFFIDVFFKEEYNKSWIGEKSYAK